MKLQPLSRIFLPSPNVLWRWNSTQKKVYVINLESGQLLEIEGSFTMVFTRLDGIATLSEILEADPDLNYLSKSALQKYIKKMLDLDVIFERLN